MRRRRVVDTYRAFLKACRQLRDPGAAAAITAEVRSGFDRNRKEADSHVQRGLLTEAGRQLDTLHGMVEGEQTPVENFGYEVGFDWPWEDKNDGETKIGRTCGEFVSDTIKKDL